MVRIKFWIVSTKFYVNAESILKNQFENLTSIPLTRQASGASGAGGECQKNSNSPTSDFCLPPRANAVLKKNVCAALLRSFWTIVTTGDCWGFGLWLLPLQIFT